jgi:chitin synthase
MFLAVSTLQGMYSFLCVQTIFTHLRFTLSRPIDPELFGDPYARPLSVASSGSNGVDTAWRRRQTIRRGVKKEVKLTNGHFITDYLVPTPVSSAVEAKWKSGVRTNEFS